MGERVRPSQRQGLVIAPCNIAPKQPLQNRRHKDKTRHARCRGGGSERQLPHHNPSASPSPARACPATSFALPRLSGPPQRLPFALAARPKSFCTSSARAEPKAAALRRIAANPAPSVLDSACCCCCFCCCFGCCFAVLPALCTFDFRAFEGVSTSLFAQAALPTANCWNAGDPAMHAHQTNQGCAGMRRDARPNRQAFGLMALGSMALGFRERSYFPEPRQCTSGPGGR